LTGLGLSGSKQAQGKTIGLVEHCLRSGGPARSTPDIEVLVQAAGGGAMGEFLDAAIGIGLADVGSGSDELRRLGKITESYFREQAVCTRISQPKVDPVISRSLLKAGDMLNNGHGLSSKRQ
jgi:hypothetical protein